MKKIKDNIFLNDKIFIYFIMDNKKILAGVLIFILIMLLFRSSRNYGTTTTTTITKTIHPNYHHNVRNPNYHPNPNYHQNVNPYKAQYYN
jgi:hypothetical protein